MKKKTILAIGVICMFLMTGLVSTISAHKTYTGFVRSLDVYPEEGEYINGISIVGVIEDAGSGEKTLCISEKVELSSRAFPFGTTLRLYFNSVLQLWLKKDTPFLAPVFVYGTLVED